jgi:GH25 family lysozyme M1 (1,4-beta-N-acetylmuramidase)
MKKAGALFTFIKITEGTSYLNGYAGADRLAARKVGMYTGFYHFAIVRPGNMVTQATAQAKFAVGALAGRAGGYATGDLPLVLDLEPIGVSGSINNAQLTSWAKTWLTYVQKRTGRAPLIYGSPSFLARLTRGVGLEKFPLWVAHYTYPAKNPLPGAVGGPFRTPWTTTSGKLAWAFWQYTSSGPGVAMGVAGGSVDQDVWNGLAPGLSAFTKGSWTPQAVDYLPADLRTTMQLAGPTVPAFGTPTTFRVSVRNAKVTPVGKLTFYVTAPGAATVVVPGVPAAAPSQGAPATYSASINVPVPGTIVKATFTSNVFGSSTKSLFVDTPLTAPVALVLPEQATLTWSTPTLSTGLTDYAIDYSADGGKTWKTWAHPNPSTNGTQTLGLVAGTYVFRVTPIYGTTVGTRSLVSIPYVVPPIATPTPAPSL